MDIKNKIAVITGGASGLGLATAKLLNRAGARIVLWDISTEKLQIVAKENELMTQVCDVCDEISVQEAIDQIIEKYSAVHILVNCAGIVDAARIVGREKIMPLADFRRVIEINLIGTMNTLRLVAAQMIKQQELNAEGERGVIINTASIAAFEGQLGQAAYAASKGGIVSLTLPAAREFAAYGIRVMTIAPGVMDTPMMSSLPEKAQNALNAAVLFPHRLGQDHEYAQLVQTIIENKYLNGSVIRLDGGIRLS